VATRSIGFFLLVTELAAAAVACGGNQFTAGGDDAGAEGGTISQVQACGDNAHFHCLEIQTCSIEQLTVDYGDEGTCETRLKLSCLNGLAAPSTGNTAERSEACAQAYPSWACADYLDDRPPTACVQALGSLASGQSCAFAGQCQTGFCAIAPGSMCGVCGAVPQAGDSCATLTTCGQLLACDTTVQQCSSFAAAGAACSRAQLCGAGLYCVGSTSTTSGTCTPAVESAGATCDPTGKNGPGCDRLAGLTCNGLSNQCATLQYSASGQPCGNDVDNQYAACASAGTCAAAVGADASAGETCSPTAADGATCDLVYGPACRDPARCILVGDAGTRGTCQFANALDCQ
jgi:hypothetical protein